MKMLDVRHRIQLNNILFTTDFSLAANAAAPYAAELARRYGAKLYALQVRPPVVNPMTPSATWRGLEEAAKAEDEQHRKELLGTFTGIRPEIVIKEGDLWSTVAAVIEEDKIDLIVMGTRGRSGIGKVLLGSVAEEIFREAPCPVLTVGPHSSAVPKQGEISRILFATDFGAASNSAAPFAVSLAQEYQAHLTLLHVVVDPKTGDLVQPHDLVASSERLLRDLVSPEAELWCVPEYAVERGVAADKILEVAAHRKIELIVLGAHNPGGFRGAATHLPIATAHRIVSHAHCPVLTVRA